MPVTRRSPVSQCNQLTSRCNSPRNNMTLRLVGLVLLAIAACGASLLAGGSTIDPSAIVSAILHPHAQGDVSTILWQLRLPRVLIAAIVGGALGVGGALLQGMLRNPLVDPY